MGNFAAKGPMCVERKKEPSLSLFEEPRIFAPLNRCSLGREECSSHKNYFALLNYERVFQLFKSASCARALRKSLQLRREAYSDNAVIDWLGRLTVGSIYLVDAPERKALRKLTRHYTAHYDEQFTYESAVYGGSTAFEYLKSLADQATEDRRYIENLFEFVRTHNSDIGDASGTIARRLADVKLGSDIFLTVVGPTSKARALVALIAGMVGGTVSLIDSIVQLDDTEELQKADWIGFGTPAASAGAAAIEEAGTRHETTMNKLGEQFSKRAKHYEGIADLQQSYIAQNGGKLPTGPGGQSHLRSLTYANQMQSEKALFSGNTIGKGARITGKAMGNVLTVYSTYMSVKQWWEVYENTLDFPLNRAGEPSEQDILDDGGTGTVVDEGGEDDGSDFF